MAITRRTFAAFFTVAPIKTEKIAAVARKKAFIVLFVSWTEITGACVHINEPIQRLASFIANYLLHY